MTTYFNGLEVPKVQTDRFTGVTFTAGPTYGHMDVTLTYTPTNLGDIIVLCSNLNQKFCPVLFPHALSGKTLTIRGQAPVYEKSDSPTATTDAAGGGAVAEPHTHTLGYTWTDMGWGVMSTLTPFNIVVMYPPEGGS